MKCMGLYIKLGLLLTLCMVLAACGKKEQYEPVLPTGVEEADIYVEKIDGISDDFIRGVDISTLIAEENSGVVYYNEAGEEEDLLKILADAGVNYIRVRVWNDPYDADGNGYGGGNCDVNVAAEIGARAAKYGMKLMVDFHYSDFWSDPTKQQCPKAWADMTVEEKAEAAYTFTKESLTTIINAGADVGIVQIGNENNTGFAGEKIWREISKIMVRCVDAINEVEKKKKCDIQVAIHLTNPEDTETIGKIAQRVADNGVEYDILALSYYPYWHGSLDDLTNAMNYIVDNFGKKVLVAETAYAYTLEDGDGNANIADAGDLTKDYTASVQSQANEVRDVMATVAAMGENGLGIFYWEPAWIPVNVYNYEADDAASVYAANQALWEKYGSGWASSYAGEYDPNDAGIYYGGSAWDNQAMFDFYGHPLASLNVFKYVKYGATCKLAVDFCERPLVNLNVDAELVLPETVYVTYNNRNESGNIAVVWDPNMVNSIDTSVVATYEIPGTLPDGTIVYCDLKVALLNWVENASFEDSDYSMWNIIYNDANPVDFQKKETDAVTGVMSMHYWSSGEVYFMAEQTLTGLEDGRYYFSALIQGGDAGDSPEMYIYAKSGENEYKSEFAVNGWCVWQEPEINEIIVTGGTVTVGVYVKCDAGGWGTIDDFYVCKLR